MPPPSQLPAAHWAAFAPDHAPLHPPAGPDAVVHRAMFCPTFHPQALVSVQLAGDVGDVALASTEGSLWLELQAQTRPDPNDPQALHVSSSRWSERAPLTPAQVAGLRAVIDPLVAAGLDLPPQHFGVDGVTVYGEVRRGAAAPVCFSAWSPGPGDPRHTYFTALHALASAALPGRSRRRLDALHGYLGLGLPARDLGGSPRRLQIFGRLSSSHEAALATFFAAVSPDEPALVDMRTFEGMGTLLFPLFREFARRPGPLVWAVSEIARRQLLDAGVPPAQLETSLRAARGRLEAVA